MDPLSITASVIAVLQAAEAVISVCCDYRSAVRGSSWEVPRVLEEVRALRNVLRILEELADKAETPSSESKSRLPALQSLCDPDTGILIKCRTELNNLATKLTPPGWVGPTGSKRRGLVQALTWPLKKGDTEKVLASIERFKSTINVAVTTDQTTSLLAIEDKTQAIEICLSSVSLDTHQQQIRKWLRATDPSSKFNKALKTRQPGTGSWLTSSSASNKWMHDPNSLLWLHGIPGCGKTVLCSTAIERVLQLYNPTAQTSVGIAYFYFDFKHQDQQVCDAMLRSLIAQLSLQSPDAFKPVDELYSACGSGTSQPSLPMTLKAAKDTIERFTDIFILVDALDECKELGELLRNVEDMVGSKIASLHMLVTSRREKEIEDSMTTLLDDEHKLCIQSTLVKDDIRAYVRGRICKDRKLKKWQKPEIQAEIEEVLVEKADGMFQWVKCQLDALGKCLSVSDLRKALRSLPKDLDDTYTRILQDIDNKGYVDQVAKILQWLAYSVRPMSLKEIAEVLTVDMESDPLVDFERRLEDPQDILELCSSLISIPSWGEEMLQFAHFSVREFSESPRLDNGPARRFAVDEMRANILIAESCIAYNIQLDSVIFNLDKSIIYEKYPLSRYAANGWSIHAKNARENGRIISLCERLFRIDSSELPLWPTESYVFYPADAQGKLLPLHCATLFSLPRFMRKLVLEGAHVNSIRKSTGQTPLAVVTSKMDERVEDVQFLLNHGAAVNARDAWGSTALILASAYSIDQKVQTVQVLLDNGADLEAQNEREETALVVASRSGHTEIVHLLLGRGASIGSSIGEKALGFASSRGYFKIVQMFLDRGVDVNARCYLDDPNDRVLPINTRSPLIRALAGQHYEVADLLLKNGADVNARSFIKDRDAVPLEHVFANEKNLYRQFRRYGVDEDGIEQHRGKMFRFLIEHGADPKLVRTDSLRLDRKWLYDEHLSECNIDLSLE